MASCIDIALLILLSEDWLYYFPWKLILCSFFIILKGPPVESMNVMAMEKLPINNNGGQGYGFILYQTTLKRVPKQITIQHVYDRAQVLSTHALQGSIWDLSFGGRSPAFCHELPRGVPGNCLKRICAEMQSGAFWDTILRNVIVVFHLIF